MITNKPNSGEPIVEEVQDPIFGKTYVATPVFWNFLDEVSELASSQDLQEVVSTATSSANAVAASATLISENSSDIALLQEAVSRLNSLISAIPPASRINLAEALAQRAASLSVAWR